MKNRKRYLILIYGLFVAHFYEKKKQFVSFYRLIKVNFNRSRFKVIFFYKKGFKFFIIYRWFLEKVVLIYGFMCTFVWPFIFVFSSNWNHYCIKNILFVFFSIV